MNLKSRTRTNFVPSKPLAEFQSNSDDALRKTRHKRRLISAVSALSMGLFMAACTQTGVTSIDFELAPVAVLNLPDELQSIDVAALTLASGQVLIDVIEGTGSVSAEILPALPLRYRYQTRITYSEDGRGDLPGPTESTFFAPAEEEHNEEEGDHAEGEMRMSTHRMEEHDDGGGDFSASFSDGDIGEQTLDAARSAVIEIAGTDGNSSYIILQGGVEFEDAAEEAGGHAHGV